MKLRTIVSPLLALCMVFTVLAMPQPVWASGKGTGTDNSGSVAPHRNDLGFARRFVRGALDEVFGYDRKLTDVEACIRALQTDDRDHVRKRAAERLGDSGETKAVDPLIAALKDPDRGVRAEAVRALGKIGDKRAEAPLLEALNEPDAHARAVVPWALAAMETTTALERVVDTLRDDDSRVRLAAASVLDKRGWEPEGVTDRLWQCAASRDWDGLREQFAARVSNDVSSTADRVEAPFVLDLPVPVHLKAQVEQYGRTDEVLVARWIAFHKENGRLAARMYLDEITNASRDWLLTVQVLDSSGQLLGHSEAVVTTMFLALGGPLHRQHDIEIVFDAPLDVSNAAGFVLTLDTCPNVAEA